MPSNVEEIIIPVADVFIVQVFILDADDLWRNWLILRKEI